MMMMMTTNLEYIATEDLSIAKSTVAISSAHRLHRCCQRLHHQDNILLLLLLLCALSAASMSLMSESVESTHEN